VVFLNEESSSNAMRAVDSNANATLLQEFSQRLINQFSLDCNEIAGPEIAPRIMERLVAVSHLAQQNFADGIYRAPSHSSDSAIGMSNGRMEQPNIQLEPAFQDVNATMPLSAPAEPMLIMREPQISCGRNGPEAIVIDPRVLAQDSSMVESGEQRYLSLPEPGFEQFSSQSNCPGTVSDTRVEPPLGGTSTNDNLRAIYAWSEILETIDKEFA
jgi:hypothetical protein